MTATEKRITKMEMSKPLISVLSIAITLSLGVWAWAYKSGEINNEMKNMNIRMITQKQDFQHAIDKLEERKADKEVLQLFLQRVESINSKIDQLILRETSKTGDK